MVSTIIYFMGGILAALYTWYRISTKRSYQGIRDITGKTVPIAEPYFLIGSSLSLFSNKILDFLVDTCKKLGKNYIFFAAHIPIFVTSDPEIIKEILYMQHQNFNKGDSIDVITPLFGNKNIFITEGEEWKRQRKIMAPAFRATTIHSMVPTITRVCNKLKNKWDQLLKENNSAFINISTESTRFTLDVISAVAFSDQDVGDELINAFNTSIKALIKVQMLSFIPFVKYLPNSIKMPSAIRSANEIFEKWVKKVIKIAEEEPNSEKSKYCLTHLLLAARDEDTGESLSFQEIRDNIALFFFAGHETTATLITYGLYYLTQNMEVQKKTST